MVFSLRLKLLHHFRTFQIYKKLLFNNFKRMKTNQNSSYHIINSCEFTRNMLFVVLIQVVNSALIQFLLLCIDMLQQNNQIVNQMKVTIQIVCCNSIFYKRNSIQFYISLCFINDAISICTNMNFICHDKWASTSYNSFRITCTIVIQNLWTLLLHRYLIVHSYSENVDCQVQFVSHRYVDNIPFK